MNIFRVYLAVLAFVLAGLTVSTANAQQVKETYTGTVISFGSGFDTRTRSATFTLNLNGLTSDAQAQQNLANLQENGQDSVLQSISKQDLGRFSVGSRVGVPLNVVRESDTSDGKRRIFIVFQRWTEFAEARGGYRSLDYPFGVIELYIDKRTGKGEGTYIAAASIRFTTDKKTNQETVEIENFATYPARLVGVSQRNRKAM